jgi:hypothetical protein
MERTPEEIERIKRIMSVPVNPKKTMEHYIKSTPIRSDEQNLISLKQNAFTQGY